MAPQGHVENEVWAIVPAKRFSRAKVRLAPVLTRSERSELARAMLHDVMTVLSSVREFAGILVASGDPFVAEVVRPFGARLVHDVLEAGVNDAVRQGLSALATDRKAGAVIVPGDVPFVTPAEMQAVLRAMTEWTIVLTPASRDSGTNCLAMADPCAIQPCFGEDSFIAHQAAARRAEISYGVCRFDGLGHDIDCPDDLVTGPRLPPGSRTGGLLDELNVAARVGQPVLQSLGRQI
jgi:2-phospho-L-lactate/phosphoenolpyruvate guanylyltransferase